MGHGHIHQAAGSHDVRLEGLEHGRHDDIHPEDEHHPEDDRKGGEKCAQSASVQVSPGKGKLEVHDRLL
jgi:hypothetical protein